jgi:hypothetical protein
MGHDVFSIQPSTEELLARHNLPLLTLLLLPALLPLLLVSLHTQMGRDVFKE